MIARDASNKYLIYRFGSKNKIEFEYPTKTKDSWDKFKFNSYMRGGGKQNAGRETFELIFTNKKVEYDVYWEYLAEDESISVGIHIEDGITGKSSHIEGVTATAVGSLTWFKENDLVKSDQ